MLPFDDLIVAWKHVAPILPAIVFTTLCAAVAVIDARTFRIPDALNAAIGTSGIGIAALLGRPHLLDVFLAAGLGFVGLWAVRASYFRLRRRHGLGLGDVKLGGALGAWLGLDGWPLMLLIASMLGLAWVGLLAALGKRIALSDRVPFGPFLSIGAVAAWLLMF